MLFWHWAASGAPLAKRAERLCKRGQSQGDTMKKKHDSCTRCGVRFSDVGLEADGYCRRCGGPVEAVAVAERPIARQVNWFDSLILLAAALALYLFPR
jgi:uncharacterized paraquat-inducible protein A